MRILVTFTPQFLKVPLAVIQKLHKKIPEEVSVIGFTTGTEDVYRCVAAQEHLNISPIFRLNELEKEWGEREDDSELARFERQYGPGTLKRLLVADRQLGTGYISGAITLRCPMVRKSRDDEWIRRYICGLLRFWETLFENEKPDLVFSGVPANAWTLSLNEYCHLQNIPYYRIHSTRVKGLCILETHHKNLLAPVIREFEQALENPNHLDDSMPQARHYLEEFRQNPSRPQYSSFTIKSKSEQHTVRSVVRYLSSNVGSAFLNLLQRREQELRTRSGFDKLLDFFDNMRNRTNYHSIRHSKLFHSWEHIHDRPFVYFPLHVDPEAATMVLAPMHVDQIAVIEALSKSIPMHWNLVVKEHNPMLGRRQKGFYERITRFPCVKLLLPTVDNYKLIQQAALTCSITGTSTWEAMMLRRPALIIGKTPFQIVQEGFVHCPDLSQLPDAVQRALTMPPASDQKLLYYLASIFQTGFEFPKKLFDPVSWETIEEYAPQINLVVDRLLEMQKGPKILVE